MTKLPKSCFECSRGVHVSDENVQCSELKMMPSLSSNRFSRPPWCPLPDQEDEGEWLERQVFTIEESTISEWQSAKCSKCGRYHTTPYMYSFHEYAFCPHCGKPMKVGGEKK